MSVHLALCVEFEYPQNTHSIWKKHLYTRNNNILDLGLALTRFRTTRPYFQQVSLT